MVMDFYRKQNFIKSLEIKKRYSTNINKCNYGSLITHCSNNNKVSFENYAKSKF